MPQIFVIVVVLHELIILVYHEVAPAKLEFGPRKLYEYLSTFFATAFSFDLRRIKPVTDNPWTTVPSEVPSVVGFALTVLNAAIELHSVRDIIPSLLVLDTQYERVSQLWVGY